MSAVATGSSQGGAPILVRTPNGKGLHLPECPHLHDCEVILDASAEDVANIPLCEWTQADLDGVGRTYFDHLAAAMRDFGTHAGTEKLIRDETRGLMYDQIWVPNSRSYIAFGLNGAAVAWIGKTYVQFKNGRFVTLPGYAPGGGGGAAGEDVRYGSMCEKHNVQRALNGACEQCE